MTFPSSPPPAPRVLLPAEADTLALGAAMAEALPPPAEPFVLFLEGDLGAGKTCLARALLQRLGVPGRIHSPSYGLLAQYEAAGWQVLHLDLYRLEDPAELELLGVRDLHAGPSLWLVEWPAKGVGYLPCPDATVHLGFAEAGMHWARLEASTPRGLGWTQRLGIIYSRQAPEFS